jgi:hypothetical protein
VNIFASTSVLFILTTVKVPNLALTHKKWITVSKACSVRLLDALGLTDREGFIWKLLVKFFEHVK